MSSRQSRVHPDLRATFAATPAFRLDDALKERTAAAPAPGPVPLDPGVHVEDRRVEGPDGAPPVRVRLYTPLSGPGSGGRPGLVWIHGGGYVLGSVDDYDVWCTRFALEVDCVVASVEYRLAPEHPFPAAIEDCYAVLTWFARTTSLGVDSLRIAVGGFSAGGGLTAALALLARDRGGPALRMQMPLCPMLDDRGDTPSSREFTDPRAWNRQANQQGWAMYLGRLAGAETPAHAAPARATDLRGLAPAYVSVGELDPLRDETMTYVARLAQAGVRVEFHLFAGCFHGFEAVAGAGVSERAMTEYIDALRRGLGPD